MAKYATTGGNRYEDSAAGAASWGLRNSWNGTGVNAKNRRERELPTSKSYSTLTEAERDHPSIDKIIDSWR
jgi:hypothetical protein